MNLRLFWRRFHLWVGASCGLFIIALVFSGIVLVFGPAIDRGLHPALYAVSGPGASQPADVYLAKARAAVPNGVAAQLRWPAEAGFPVLVLMRLNGEPPHPMPDEAGHHDRAEAPAAGGARPRVLTVYLDPPTATVLGTADVRASFVGLAHSLHEDLLMPALNGRTIVGINGAGLFILCLTGIYLWWPRGAGLLRALGWRRGPAVSINLHHRVGFWIVLPLAVMAITGMFQAFLQPGRALVGAFAPVSPQPMRQGSAGGGLQQAHLEAQQALDLARAFSSEVNPGSR